MERHVRLVEIVRSSDFIGVGLGLHVEGLISTNQARGGSDIVRGGIGRVSAVRAQSSTGLRTVQLRLKISVSLVAVRFILVHVGLDSRNSRSRGRVSLQGV